MPPLSPSGSGLKRLPQRTGVRAAIAGVLALAVATLPWTFGTPYLVGQVYAAILLALLTTSLTLSLGVAGELAVAQVVYYAAGAYAAGYIGKEYTNELLVTLPAAVLAALVIGFLIAAPSLRLGGWALGVVSFFAVIVLPNVIKTFKRFTGGLDGLIALREPAIFGYSLSRNTLFVVAVALTATCTVGLRNLVVSRHGTVLRAMRQSPILTTSLGVSTFRLKLTVHLLAAVPAGVAGALFAYWYRFAAPSSFAFALVVAVLAASLLGGQKSVLGPVLGAAILQLGPLQSSSFSNSSLLVYGLLLLVAGVALPEGLIGASKRLVAWIRSRSATPAARPAGRVEADAEQAERSDPVAERHGEVLRADDISVSFGGVRALDGVSLVAQPGAVTALIGGNGSGKTTLVNVISGFLVPEAGSVHLGDDALDGLGATERARRGLRRTFQTPIIPEDMSTADAVGVARYHVDRLSIAAALFRLPSFRRVLTSDAAWARQSLRQCDLLAAADAPAASLPLGLRRLTEVARAIAGSPRVVLLDEPAAGLEEAEIEHLETVVDSLRAAGLTVLLIEHNFDLIRALADTVYVLDRGELLRCGTPAEVEQDPVVRERYFGLAAQPRETAEVAG